MSVRFFRGLILNIFLVSLHVLSMQENIESKKKIDQDTLSACPFSDLNFEQRSIVLSPNNVNQYSLIFNSKSQPHLLTHYLLADGKCIGKSLQIDDQISFESNDCQPYTLSFQIPFQTSSLTINTQGRCLFEKPINVDSAYIAGRTINFADMFMGKSSLIVEAHNCKIHDQLACSNFLFNGNKCSVLSKGVVTIQDTFHCISEIFNHNGMLNAFNCIMEKGNTFYSTSSSVWNIHGDWKSLIVSLYLKGSFSVKNVSIRGKNFIAQDPFHCIAENAHFTLEENMSNEGVIKVLELLDIDAKNIELQKTSSLIVENADLKVNQSIQNEGTVSVKNHLVAHAHSISNEGRIEARNSTIKADRYYYNAVFSTLSAKNSLAINTPLSLNFLSLTHAQSIEINSLIGLNTLGIYAAKNMSMNALFSLNAGLLFPKFNTFTEMCSLQNLWGLGESLFIKYVPQYGAIYSVLKNLQGLYYQGKSFCHAITSLKQQRHRGVSDIIAMICLMKNLGNSIKQTTDLSKQSHTFISSVHPENLSHVSVSSSEVIAQSKKCAQEIISSAIFHYGSSINTHSIADFNWGIAMGVSNYSDSFYNRNINTSLFIHNTINTWAGKNIGYLYAYNLLTNAINSYCSESKINLSSGAIKTYDLSLSGSMNAIKGIRLEGRYVSIKSDIQAEQLEIKSNICSLSGNIEVSNGVVEADTLSVNGQMNAKENITLEGKVCADIKGNMKAHTIATKSDGKITNHAHLNSSNAHMRAKSISQYGLIDSKENVLIAGDSVENFGNVKAPKIFITQAHPDDKSWSARGRKFFNQGSLQSSEQLIVDAKNICLSGVSQISAPDSCLKSDGYFENYGEINGERLIIDAQKDAENSGAIKASQLITKANGDDDGFFARRRKFLNRGNLQVSEHLVIDAKNIHLNEASQVAAPNAYFKSSGNWENDGQLKATECFIESQSQAVNNGTIHTDELLRIKAQDIFFEEKSDIKTKDAYGYARRNVILDGKTDIESGSIKAKDKVTAIGKVGASNQLDIEATNITIAKKSEVRADKTSLKAKETITNRGQLSASQLFAHGKYVENAGSILVDKAHIKADRYFWNKWLSSVEAKEYLTIDVFALCNTLGYIRSDSLCTNAILDVNLLGMYRGCNISRNSIVGVNAGILIPDYALKLSAKEMAWMIGGAALKQFGSIALQYYCPCAYTLGSLLLALGCSYNRGERLYNQVQTLRTKKDLCASDIVPAICEAKNLIDPAMQIGLQAWNLGKDTWGYFTTPSVAPMYSLAQNGWDIQQFFSAVIPSVISSLGPQLSNNSLFDINAGIMLGINGTSQSLYNTNIGASLFANNYSVNTIAGTNTGFLGASNLSVNVLASYSNHGKIDAINLSMIANDLDIAGNIHASNNALLKAHRNAVIDRKIKAKQATIDAKNILIKENASILSHHKTQVAAKKKLINKGTLDGNQTVMQGNEVILADGSKVLAQGNKAATQITAQKLHLKDGSQINAPTNLIEARSIKGEKENTINSQNGTFIKINELYNKGTVHGLLILDFKGNADQLTTIGSIEQLAYKGTIANDLADRLADGDNELLDVAQAGAVTICAGEQDVHLKEKHELTHTLMVQTEGAITSDKDLFSEKSLLLQAKGNIQHASIQSQELTGLIGKNISSESHVKREYDDKNYNETCEKSVISGEKVLIQAEEDIHYKATQVHSGVAGTQLFFGNTLIADDLKAEKYSKTETAEMQGLRKKTVKNIVTHEDTVITTIPSTFSSDGITYAQGNTAELHGTMLDSKGGTVINAHIKQVPTYDIHIQAAATKNAKTNEVIHHSESITKTERPVLFNDTQSSHIISDQPVSLCLAGSTPRINIDAPVVEIRTAKDETGKTCFQDKIHVALWNRGTRVESYDVACKTSYSGIINTNAHTIRIEDTKGNIPAPINTPHPNASITRLMMEDIHKYQKQTLYSRPTKLCMGIIALSLSFAMQALGPVVGTGIAKIGMESVVLSAMTTQATVGAMNALCQETANTLLHCNGDFRGAAKKLARTKMIRNIAIAALTVGVTAGADQLVSKVVQPLSHATTFNQRLLSAAPRELIKGGIQCASDIAQGKKPQEAAKNSLKSTIANTVGSVGSSQIGKAYRDKKIDPLTHKALHTGLGALEGAITNGKQGAIAGAIGAGFAETITDIACPKPPTLDDIKKREVELGRPLTLDEFAYEWDTRTVDYLKQAHSVGDASKMIAATVALLTNQDADIAYNSATKAVDNNFFALIDYGIFAKDVAYALYKVPQIYEEKGIEEALKCLGIDTVCAGGKLVLGRALNEVVFKVGSKLYPSASAAINAILDQTPGLKQVMGNFAKTLTEAGEKLTSHGFGKQVVTVFENINRVDNQICTIEKKVLGKAVDTTKQVLNPSIDSLVEHSIPDKVLSKVEEQLAKNVAKESTKQLALPAPVKTLRLPIPTQTKNPKVQPTSALSKAKRELAKKPAGKIPKHLTRPTASAKDLNAEPLALSVPEKVLSLPKPVEGKVVKESSGKIKRFPIFDKRLEEHIFSENHVKGGIMNLGLTKEIINDKLVEIIKKADIRNLLKEGPNNIVTKIKGQEVTIRAFLKKDCLLSYDGFMGTSKRKVDNIIYI